MGERDTSEMATVAKRTVLLLLCAAVFASASPMVQYHQTRRSGGGSGSGSGSLAPTLAPSLAPTTLAPSATPTNIWNSSNQRRECDLQILLQARLPWQVVFVLDLLTNRYESRLKYVCR